MNANKQIVLVDIESAVAYLNKKKEGKFLFRFIEKSEIVTDSTPGYGYYLEAKNIANRWNPLLYGETKKEFYLQLNAFAKGLEWRKI